MLSKSSGTSRPDTPPRPLLRQFQRRDRPLAVECYSASGAQTLLPSLSGKLFEILSLDSLRPSKKGFLEPDEVFCTEIKLSSIDCILVPGLLFDEKKHRLGFGGGFYDRLFRSKNQRDACDRRWFQRAAPS